MSGLGMCDPAILRIVKVERPMMRGWCVAFFCLFLGLIAHAQDRTIGLVVLDSLERTPIDRVDVTTGDADDRSVCVTDAFGRCTISVPSDGGSVHLSRAGYVSRDVDPRALRNGVGQPVELLLAPLELVGVVVTRPKPEVVFNRPDLHAADLLINDAGIWVLAYERPRMLRAEAEARQEILREVRLVLLDSLYRETASCAVPEDVLGLRRDLRNAVVIEGTTTAYAVSRTGDDIALVPFGLEDLRKSVLPWTDSIPGWVLGSNTDRIMPAFDHLAYDPVVDSVRVVTSVVDSFMISLFRSEYRSLKGPEKVIAMNLAHELGVDKEIVAGYMSGFQNNIWFKPLYAPLFVVGDTMLVFDHANGYLRKITRAFDPVGRVPLTYLARPDGRDWCGRVVQDQVTQRLFAVFQRNGNSWLRSIDPVSGAMGERFRVTYRYPERLQVHNDAVYYIYRPVESLQKRSIYREKLR